LFAFVLQVSAELSKDKGKHFQQSYKGQRGVWAVRSASAFDDTQAANSQAAVPAAGAAQSEAPASEQQEEQQQQQRVQPAQPSPSPASSIKPANEPRRKGRGRGRPKASPAKAAPEADAAQPSGDAPPPQPPSPKAPGNYSMHAPWKGLTCRQLATRMLHRQAAVWTSQGYFHDGFIEGEGAKSLLAACRYGEGRGACFCEWSWAAIWSMRSLRAQLAGFPSLLWHFRGHW
jgi:hypothetical protein